MGNIPCICIGSKKELIDQRTDVNRRATVTEVTEVDEIDDCGQTALHSVVTRNGSEFCVECVDLLTQYRADINVYDRNTDTPLHYAVDNRKIEWVKLLLEHGANVNSGDVYNETPLLHAVKYTNLEYVQLLLQYGADVNICNFSDFTPLSCAVLKFNVECVKLLLEHGATINVPNGVNPLFSAVNYNNVECLKLLLQHGANVNANLCDRNNTRPLHWAVNYNKIVTCIKLFLKRQIVNLHDFENDVRKTYVECVKLLLQKGAKVDELDYNHNTALNVAARDCHLEIIKLLLQYNANVNTKNLHGQTPLMQAAIKVSELNTENNVACLELLIQASSQFDLCNEYNELILETAHNKKIGEILLPYCADPHSLRVLCRHQIRSSLQYQILPDVIPSLNLPNYLQKFLLLQ